MICKHPRTEKQPEASNSKIFGDTTGMKKAVSPVCRIKIKACAAVAGVMNSEHLKEWLDAVEFKLKITIRAINVAVLTPVLNVHEKFTGTRWAKVNSDGHFKTRLLALGWKQSMIVESRLHLSAD